MKVDYVRNLLFQKSNYPEVFKSYSVEEVAQKSILKVSAKEKLFFYLVIDESIGILEFIDTNFNTKLNYKLPISFCLLQFGYDEKIYSGEDGMLRIEINHPYLDKDKPIVLSHSIEQMILEKSYAFYTYNTKPFKQLTEIKIKRYCEYEHSTHNIETREELFNQIKRVKPTYSFSVSQSDKKADLYLQDTSRVDEISLIVIRTINEVIDQKENAVIAKCSDAVLEFFSIKTIEILSRYLRPGEFSHNFILVERLFLFEKKFNKEMDNYLKDTILISVRDYKKMKSNYAERYNAISADKGILKLNAFMEIQLKRFIDLLEGK